jgi:hypothetical protein
MEASPRGMTPLNDATGKLVSLARKANADKTAIIIVRPASAATWPGTLSTASIASSMALPVSA